MDVKESNRQLKIFINTEHIRQHLMKVGLINQYGEILPKEEYERRCRRKHQLTKEKQKLVPRPSTSHNRKKSKSPDERKFHRRNKSQSPRRLSSPNPSTTRPISRNIELKENHRCTITMIFYGMPCAIQTAVRTEINDIIVMQQHCGGENLFVYKGSLRPNDTFQFESRRHSTYPFALAFYVNGLINSRLSICCESRYQHNVRIGGKRGLFGILNVENSKACRRCRMERRMKRLAELKAKKYASIAYKISTPEPNFTRSSSSDLEKSGSIVLNDQTKRKESFNEGSLNVHVPDEHLQSSRSTNNENLLSSSEHTPIHRRVTSAHPTRRRATIVNEHSNRNSLKSRLSYNEKMTIDA